MSCGGWHWSKCDGSGQYRKPCENRLRFCRMEHSSRRQRNKLCSWGDVNDGSRLAGQNVCAATGNNFPDALAGSVYAANHNASIILADGNLSDQVMNYLKDKKLTGAAI